MRKKGVIWFDGVELVSDNGSHDRKECVAGQAMFGQIERGEPVVLVNSELTDKVRVVVLPSTPFRPPVLGALGLPFRVLPEPCRPAMGDPRTPPPDRGSAALRETAETDPSGSMLVGVVIQHLGRF